MTESSPFSRPQPDEHVLTAIATRLIDIESVSENEAVIEDELRSRVSMPLVYDFDSVLVFANDRRPGLPLVVIAGHTDTVPIEDNHPSRMIDEVIWGRGASDMKAGLAVMVALSDCIQQSASPSFDVALVFFGREELPADANPLPAALRRCPHLAHADLAILMEPTNNAVEAGCQGNLNLRLTFAGSSAHTARPWLGVNAVHQAILGLQGLALNSPVDVEVDGLVFREVATVTSISGGVARNVVPPAAEVDINVRYNPTCSPQDAERFWIAQGEAMGAAVEVVSNAAPAPVVLNNSLVQALLRSGGQRPAPKQAWTNAADFAAVNIPAVNFGPGDPALAHTRDERVTVQALTTSFTAMTAFLGL